ncbi:hypothetical protein LCGC14_0856930 [marine sediment metagenome]|uniref:Uncharacterized protein n=1 Tax=marine sediment metagenome TaxID=412755 RepID=A0A0F9PTY0_9ZZZZ
MDYDDKTYASDTFLIRFFWKTVRAGQASYLQLTVSRIVYTQLINEMDRGINGAYYKVIDASQEVHRINKYEIRNFVAWETRRGRVDSGLRLT